MKVRNDPYGLYDDRSDNARAEYEYHLQQMDIDDSPGYTTCANCGNPIPDSDTSDTPMCGECYLLLQDDDIY